jgi:hypothetical protein
MHKQAHLSSLGCPVGESLSKYTITPQPRVHCFGFDSLIAIDSIPDSYALGDNSGIAAVQATPKLPYILT